MFNVKEIDKKKLVTINTSGMYKIDLDQLCVQYGQQMALYNNT